MEQTFSDLMALTLGDIGLPSDHLVWKALLLTIISLLVGILGGFVGLALGTIRLPALLLLGTPAAIAGGTNIMVSSLSSCLLYTSPSPRDRSLSRMPSSA